MSEKEKKQPKSWFDYIQSPWFFPTLIGVLLLIVIIFVSFDHAARWLFGDEKNANGEYLKILFSIVAAIGAAYALHVANKRAKASIENVTNQNKQIAQIDKTQMNEQFQNAIEMLSSDNEVKNKAAVHQLHQLVKNSPTDYTEITLNILLGKLDTLLDLEKPDWNSKSICLHILSVLCKREFDKEQKQLSNCNLSELKLTGLHFTMFSFNNCLMPRRIYTCRFQNSYIQNCLFNESFINGSQFIDTTFGGSYFVDCNMNGNIFSNEGIVQVTFRNCSIRHQRFYGSVSNSIFHDCEFYYTGFEKLNNRGTLLKCNFMLSSFDGVTFSNEIRICNFNYTGHSSTRFRGNVFNSLFKNVQNFDDFLPHTDPEFIVDNFERFTNDVSEDIEFTGDKLSINFDNLPKPIFEKMLKDRSNYVNRLTDKVLKRFNSLPEM